MELSYTKSFLIKSDISEACKNLLQVTPFH